VSWFYLILKVAGLSSLCYGNDYLPLVMFVTGYWGEVVDPGKQHGDSPQVLLISIVYEIWIVRLQNWQKLPVETHLLHTKYYVGSYL
jgi:hypothetical protein